MKRLLVIVAMAAVAVVVLAYCAAVVVNQQGGTMRSHVSSLIDPPAPAVTVRVLDVGQGDASYIHNGPSRIIVDGGPDERRFGFLLDSLGLRDTVIDVVVLSHAHADHYRGLLALFDSDRRLRIRYFFENKEPSSASSLMRLRDSIISRIHDDSLIYRSTDDPCGDGRSICSITLRGGAKLHILRPAPAPEKANDRSVALKLVGPDSASFSMWLAGDAERSEIRYFLHSAAYPQNPGMRVDVLKADHHGSCNGVSPLYLSALHPSWVIASLGAQNDYGHMHTQAKAAYSATNIPWLRTDQNGTITIQSLGTPGSTLSVVPSRGAENADGPSDRESRQGECREM